LALVRKAKQPRQDIIKAALAKTLALAFAECKLLGFDSGAPWCPHRVERRASPQFVSRLFDDYARQFEPMLLETLNYCAHARVADLISEQRRDGRILDAGCGSGLLGAELRKRSPETELFGVDVSSKIAKLARDKRDAAGRPVYDEVVVGDLVDARAYSRSFDVVAASDVCCYFGDLERLFETFAGVLEPDGLVAFTTETDEAAEDAPDGPNAGGGRYAHGDAYVDRAAAAVGWSRVSKARFVPRREAGRPVEGTLWLFRRPLRLGTA
jgi:predicted TPR repeat methyltransferase